MIKFKHRYCKVHMAQYLSGDLPTMTRRHIARFIDECQDCYDEYIRHRALTDELERNLPAFGRPDANRLDNIWLSLQSELVPAGGQTRSRAYNGSNLSIGYGLILTLLALALLLSMTVGFRASLIAVELPPRPQVIEVVKTPDASLQARRDPLVSTQSRVSRRRLSLQNTPFPHFPQ